MSARPPLNVALFGTGQMAGIYGAILAQRPDCRLVAAVGNTPEKTAAFARGFGIAGFAEGNYEEALRRHPEIDAIVITTPEWVRSEPIGHAVRHGANILLEKPFTANLDEALGLERLLAGYPRVFEICHVLRSSGRFHAMQRAVAAGDIGDVRHIYARRNSNRRRVRRVLGKTDLAFWLAPHDIDIMRWITGDEVARVHAVSRAGLRDEDDYLIANLHFSRGVDAVLEVSWCTPPVSGAAREAVFEAWGTKGSLELEDFDMNLRVYSDGERVKTYDTYEDFEVYGLRQGMFKTMVEHFVRRVHGGEISATPLRDAVESVRACAMIRRSLDEGRTVVRE